MTSAVLGTMSKAVLKVTVTLIQVLLKAVPAKDDTSNTGNANSLTTESNPSILANSKIYQLVTKWGGLGKGPGQFNHPASIDNDPNGQRFYVADLDNNRVTSIARWRQFYYGMGNARKR